MRVLAENEVKEVSGGLSAEAGMAMTIGLMALAPAPAVVITAGAVALVAEALMS